MESDQLIVAEKCTFYNTHILGITRQDFKRYLPVCRYSIPNCLMLSITCINL